MAGWSITQIVTQVQKRTENRANNLVDMVMEFLLALDEFVGEQHFWWRKKRASFTTVVGTQSYDLTAAAGGNASDMAELDTVLLMNPDGITVQADLPPITDAQSQLAAVLNTVQAPPAAYFIDTQLSPQTLRLQAPPNVAQKIIYTYWAIPMMTDTTATAIPSMIPTFLHWGLVYALERRIFEFLYGQEDPRFVVSDKRYEAFVAKAALSKSWTSRATTEARTNENYVDTVQAHG